MSERNETQLPITPQTFLDIPGIMFIGLDKQGNVVLINRKGCDILEYAQEEIVGKNWFDHFIPKGVVENVKSIFRQLMDGKIKSAKYYENPVLTKSGQEKIISWHNSVLRDEDGNITGILSSGTDVTERIKLEETVEKERQDFKLIINSSPIIVFYKDQKGRFVRVNKAFADALKIAEEDFLGKTVFDLYSKEIAQGMTNDDHEVFKSGRAKLNIIEQYESASGIRWVQTDKIPIFDKNGIPVGLIGFAQDITKHKQAEDEVRKMARLTSQNPNPVLSVSCDGFVQFKNRASSSLLKVWKYQKNRTLSGEPLKLIQTVYHTKRIKRIEVDCKHKTCMLTFTPILDSNCVHVYGLDITERKKAENRIAHLNAVLRAIRNINQLITHEKNPKRLIQRICGSLVEIRGYQSAWIALLDDSGNFSVSAEAGIGKDFSSMVEQLKKGNLPSCGEKALKGAGVLITQKPNAGCLNCTVNQIYPENKNMTLRLEYHRQVYGLMSVSVSSEMIIDSEEKHLFKEIANDIAFALHNMEIEKEQKQAEEKLEKSQSMLDMAESVAHIGSWRWDHAMNKVTWSKEMFHLYGIDEAEFDGDVEHVVSMRVHPEDLPAVKQANDVFLQERRPMPLEYRIVLPDGKERIVWAEGRRFYNESGLVVALVGYVQDITERKKAEETLKESEERFRTFMKQAPVAIFVLDLDGRILLQNDLACKYTGYSKEELLTMNISEIDHEVISKEHRKRYWDKLNVNEYMKFEGVHKRKDNSTYPAEIQIVKIKFREQPMILGFFSNITERKQSEDQIKKDLKEKEVLLREIHHRVKNNLQIIKSLLNLQSEQVKSKTLINAFNECVSRIQSMAMVHEQLYYSDDLTNIPFKTYIKKISNELIRSYHLKTAIALNLKIEDIFLSIDKAIPLGLILNELLTNAIKYAFLGMENGRVTISLKLRKDQFYELIFRDDGIGIPKNINFEKTESLGLYLIKILTQQIDGTVMMTSDHGTVYKIVFPKV